MGGMKASFLNKNISALAFCQYAPDAGSCKPPKGGFVFKELCA